MIENDNLALKKLKDFREGKIKQGLGIGVKEFDKHFVFKESEFNGILGLDNVGKTFWLMY